jgi:hypothetical protein
MLFLLCFVVVSYDRQFMGQNNDEAMAMVAGSNRPPPQLYSGWFSRYYSNCDVFFSKYNINNMLYVVYIIMV